MAQAPQIGTKTVSEARNIAVSFANQLDTSPNELLTGTPTVSASPSGLTFANVAVNSVARTINGVTVAIGKAVQCKVTGGTAGQEYTLTVTAGTDATPAQTLITYCRLLVVT